MARRLEGKVAIITGAAGGQGSAEARLFAEEGAQVALTDTNSKGEDVAASIGQNALFMIHDISEESSWDGVIAKTLESFGKIDVLVNNAAIYQSGRLQETERAVFERLIKTNQIGTFLGMRSVIKPMSDRGGRIYSQRSFSGSEPRFTR